MNNSPKLKPNRYDAIVAALVLLLAVVCALRFAPSAAESGALTVVVTIDGAEVERFPMQGDFTARTYTNNGYTLTLAPAALNASARSAQGSDMTRGVCVLTSDCPTQDCVRTGVISRAGQSIVCLPARIAVTLVGSADYDVIAG